MSESSDSLYRLNIYEEELDSETVCDCSSQGLEVVPDINNKIISVLYLQYNKITYLPEDFFPSLPALIYLDLRGNQLTEIPKTINKHSTLTYLLLQNNRLTSLPDELGTVPTLKVLQLNGNSLTYPPEEVIQAGITKIISFLHDKYIENLFLRSQSDFSEDAGSVSGNYCQEVLSYNSVIHEEELKQRKLSVKINEKESDSEEEYLGQIKGKCPKLDKSRHATLPSVSQSSKYLKPLRSDSILTQTEKIKQAYLKDLAVKKHKDLLAAREKILQQKKNMQLLCNWRKSYRNLKHTSNGSYRLQPNKFPYGTNPEYMTLLNREDIEKDLPDKYKRNLIRKCKPSVPRKSNNDVHLALKIKQLFETLEDIDLNKEEMTPRTEQKVLLNEIQKISEIKQKLNELSSTNTKSVLAD